MTASFAIFELLKKLAKKVNIVPYILHNSYENKDAYKIPIHVYKLDKQRLVISNSEAYFYDWLPHLVAHDNNQEKLHVYTLNLELKISNV